MSTLSWLDEAFVADTPTEMTLSWLDPVFVEDTAPEDVTPSWLDQYFTGQPIPAVSTITLVTPRIADIAGGGQPIAITGTNFVEGCTVTICGVAATNVIFISSTSITCVPGVSAATVGYVVVTNPDAQTATSILTFEYWSPAQIAGISLYIDAAKGVTSLGGTPNKVSNWADQSGAGHNLAQTFDPGRPYKVANTFGTLPSIDFAAIRYMGIARVTFGAGGYSTFWVAKWTSSKTSTTPSSFGYAATPLNIIGEGSGFTTLGMSAGSLAISAYSNTSATRGSGLNDGNTRLLGWTWSDTGNTAKAYVGTTQQGADVTSCAYHSGNNGYAYVGAGRVSDPDAFDGSVGAVIISAGIISGADLAKLHAWSQQRFGAI